MIMKRIKFGFMGMTAFFLVAALSGCAAFSDWFKTVKGSLIGNSYMVYQYDNSGSQTLQLQGSRIDISPYKPKTNSDGETVLNSVLDITIDGSQVLAVGNTLIFEETGVDKLAGFEEIQDFANVYSESGLRFIPFDNFVNDVRNSMGKGRMILVYSQLGEPIGIYQGNEVYVTIPDDLPKMTRINIDGKSLYLHRVNYTIIDSGLIK